MKFSRTMDLTTGPVYKNLITFAFPFMIANVVSSLYNLVDMLIVGQFCGAEAIAGVNIGVNIMHIINSLVMGFSTGISVLVAQYRGANDKEGIYESVNTMITFCLPVIAVMTLFLVFTNNLWITISKTPPEAVQDGRWYLLICCIGIIFVFGYSAMCAILRALGDSTKPMLYSCISAVINILLDLLLVAVLDLRAAGAAAATIISQAICFILALVNLLKRPDYEFRINRGTFHIHKPTLKLLLKVSLPSSFQLSFVAFAAMIVIAFINEYGIDVASGYAVGSKSGMLFSIFSGSITSAITVAVGQNAGAGKFDRIRSYVNKGVLTLAILSVLYLVVLQLFAYEFSAVFTSDPNVIRESVRYIRTGAMYYLPLCILFSYQSLLTGIGFTSFLLVLSAVDGIVMRLGISFLLDKVFGLGIYAHYFAIMLAPTLPAVIAALYFYKGNWEKRCLIRKK